MLILLVRNRVENYSKWKNVFDAQDSNVKNTGLELTELWSDLEDPNNVFFTFRVHDIVKARALLTDPKSEEVGREAGVIEGEFYFLEKRALTSHI